MDWERSRLGNAEATPPADVPVMRIVLLVILGTALTTGPVGGGLMAQASPAGPLRGVALGGSIDRFIYNGSSHTAFTFRFSGLRPGGVGPEVGISLFPQVLPMGALVLAPDMGASYSISLPGATLLLKGGASALTLLAPQAGELRPGLHVGGGLIFRLDNRTGIRLDVIRHFYREFGETEGIWSIGLGFTALPRRKL
jgi:hypothetical protein